MVPFKQLPGQGKSTELFRVLTQVFKGPGNARRFVPSISAPVCWRFRTVVVKSKDGFHTGTSTKIHSLGGTCLIT